jgi:RNA polymerase sigma-70 factor (ECF subfamily)
MPTLTNDAKFQAALVELMPQMRAFARSLTGDASLADDLAQDAVLKAWNARASFEIGTNMKAWTFMILRNQFYSDKRRSWRSQPLDQEVAERTLVASDNPLATLELADARRAMMQLSEDQREALILIGAAGLSYEEAAEICGCAIGTVKSRVSRARDSLQAILAGGDLDDADIPASDAFAALQAEATRLRRPIARAA